MKNICNYFLILFCLLFTATSFADTFQEGRDYLTLPTTTTTPSKHATIVEFFSVGCPWCYHLEPQLEQWLKTKPKNITFERVPVEFEPAWTTYATAYYVANGLGVENKIVPALFDAIQKQNRDLTNEDAMADFFAANGVNKKEFLSAYNSPTVKINLAKGRQLINDYVIYQVPTIVINGKYKVDPSLAGSNERMLQIVNYLINKK